MAQQRSGFIDLHSHTTESDGSLSPQELVTAAVEAELDALAITDHDTFSGYELALPYARTANLDLVRGIELTSNLAVKGYGQRSIHVLGYWAESEPKAAFVRWLQSQKDDRRSRNEKLIGALRARNVDITLSEVEALGKSLTGRPHFAKILVAKGYATDTEDAFQRYIGETAPAYVERQSFSAHEVVRAIADGGGIPVVAHPVRMNLPRGTVERDVLVSLKDAGLLGLEVQHSEHGPDLQEHYRELSEDLGLLPTGGSDFHGTIKPDVALRTGRGGNVRVPKAFLEGLRSLHIR